MVKWYEFNDALVRPVNRRSVSSGEAYVLFFERAGSSPV